MTEKRPAAPMRKAPVRPKRPDPKPHQTLPPHLQKRAPEKLHLTRHALHGHHHKKGLS